MKNTLVLLASLLLICGCEELFSGKRPVITLDSDWSAPVEVAADGESFEVSFTSSHAWTSEIVYSGDSEGWASLNRTGGEGGYAIEKVKVVIGKNDSGEERSARLVIRSDDVSEEVGFTQAAAPKDPGPDPDPETTVFRLAEGSAAVGAEGGDVQVTVQYNVDYECKVTVDWIREVETRAYDEKVHTFEIDANAATESRTATISFCGNELCIPFVITQEGAEAEYYLEVDKKSLPVEAAGTVTPVTVNVTSNLAWSVNSGAEWCTVSPASGENDGSFTVTVSENASSESRSADVTVVSADGTISRNIAVIQSPARGEEGDDAWKTAGFHHRSLAFRFTADWCGFCPMMAASMSEARKQLSGRLEVISVHGGGSGLACGASETLVANYLIASFPTGLVDGRTYIENGAVPVTTSMIVQAVNETESKYETVTAASWTSSVSGSQVTLNLSAYVKKAGSYKITALLVEDNIIGYQADYNGVSSYSYKHDGVLRAALSDVLGESFEVSEDGQVKEFAYTAALPSECNDDNVRVVVYIQKMDASSNAYYVDNAASAALGKPHALELASGAWGEGNEGIVPGDDITL